MDISRSSSLSSLSLEKEQRREVFKEFNRGLKKFIREMIEVYPEIKELKMMLAAYKVMKTLSYKRPQRVFNSLIADKHSADIINGNFDVFLDESFTYDGFSDICEGLKKAFKGVDNANKQAIRDHMLALLYLNKKCLEI